MWFPDGNFYLTWKWKSIWLWMSLWWIFMDIGAERTENGTEFIEKLQRGSTRPGNLTVCYGKWPIYSWFTFLKGRCSIVILVYQRVGAIPRRRTVLRLVELKATEKEEDLAESPITNESHINIPNIPLWSLVFIGGLLVNPPFGQFQHHKSIGSTWNTRPTCYGQLLDHFPGSLTADFWVKVSISMLIGVVSERWN